MIKRILFSLLTVGVFVACEKDDSPDHVISETEAVIDGEEFTPTSSTIIKSDNGLTLTFEGNAKEITIITNDTISGTYTITNEILKSAGNLFANINYSDGINNYQGTNGTVGVTRNSDGTFSGTYEASLTFGQNSTIEISSGSFASIQSTDTPEEEPEVITEITINDTLTYCYGALNSVVQSTYLFDAVYGNTTAAPNSSWTTVYQHNVLADNAKVTSLWNEAMDVIHVTNFIINNSTTAIIADESSRYIVLAQAKAIRAYLYFNLLNWFGSLPLDNGLSSGSIARSTQAEVLEAIGLDATFALEILPISWTSSADYYRIDKNFIKALNARIALFEGNYQNAYTLVQDIINTNSYALSTDPANFTESNSEIIFGFPKGANTEFNTFFAKGSYVPLFRLTEQYLIAAETAFTLGMPMDALQYYNPLKVRRGEEAVASLTKEDLLQQWKTEMTSEGNLFSTLKRFETAISELLLADYELLLPIPAIILESNPMMTQNPGY